MTTADNDRRIVDWQDDLEYGERWARLKQPAQRFAMLVLWTACVWMYATSSAEADCEPFRASTAPATARVETVYPPSAPVFDTDAATDAGRALGVVLADTFTTTTPERSKL